MISLWVSADFASGVLDHLRDLRRSNWALLTYHPRHQ